jgi:hypothetical protein
MTRLRGQDPPAGFRIGQHGAIAAWHRILRSFVLLDIAKAAPEPEACRCTSLLALPVFGIRKTELRRASADPESGIGNSTFSRSQLPWVIQLIAGEVSFPGDAMDHASE